MDMEVSLKEQLLDVVDDLESILKQVLQNLFSSENKSGVAMGESLNEKLKASVGSFNEKQTEFGHLLRKVPEHQERAQYIRTLEECVEQRDQLIGRLANEIKSIEGSIMESTYQAEKKLKSVKQSELNRVFSEDVIRFAHQISKHHSVASSMYWQQGDPSRPYPTNLNFAVSSLLLSRTQPSHPFISQSSSNRPIFNVPGMPQKPFSPCPRPTVFGANVGGASISSPRGRPHGTGARMASPSARPKILQRTSSQQSPRFSQLTMPGQQQQQIQSPGHQSGGSPMVQTPHSAGTSAAFMSPGSQQQSQQQMVINLPTGGGGTIKPFAQPPDVQRIEQMSSESSSSSSSGDEGSPNDGQ